MEKPQLHYFFPKALIVYMLLALLWWALLLFRKNNEYTTERLKVLQIESNVVNKVNNYDIKTLDKYDEIMSKHKRQKLMIMGEGLVFGLSLIIGMGFINRAYGKEIANNKRQNNFLLSITHELKSPLASIGLILETLKKRKLNKAQRDDLTESALKENKRLDKLINNLLLATRLEEAYNFNFEKTNIIPILKDITDRYGKLNDNLSIELVSKQNEFNIDIDKEGFDSMISNIVENAIKYGNRTPIIELSVDKIRETCIISIADRGIGIPADEIGMVTEQFYRIGNEETRKTKGTGLGLFIVNKILKAHHGTMKIKPNIPKGTIFELTIPIKYKL